MKQQLSEQIMKQLLRINEDESAVAMKKSCYQILITRGAADQIRSSGLSAGSRLLKVDGVWKIVEDCDRWIRMYSKPIKKQQPSVVNLAPICFFIDPFQVSRSLPMVKNWGWARVCKDVLAFSLFSHLDPIGSTNLCTYLVAIGPVVDRTDIQKRSVNNVQYNIQIVDSLGLPSIDSVTTDPIVDTVPDSTVDLDTSQSFPDADLVSPSSYSDSPMHFTTADIPLASPDHRNRPGGGGGSRSGPAKKRGGSSQSGGGRTRQRGFRY
ncbi:hypothetical protein F511_26880 [Dorcoceras hygrometricum]|uniref:Uncharacterized protein n=1 Tax=Dorcoceras hygrometricum TaxID=472368 RepID=A0A2Z7AA76_9LAMI|nr:hypothetical protein F511_26880 [Dorcoceras hygrometricum]